MSDTTQRPIREPWDDILGSSHWCGLRRRVAAAVLPTLRLRAPLVRVSHGSVHRYCRRRLFLGYQSPSPPHSPRLRTVFIAGRRLPPSPVT